MRDCLFRLALLGWIAIGVAAPAKTRATDHDLSLTLCLGTLIDLPTDQWNPSASDLEVIPPERGIEKIRMIRRSLVAQMGPDRRVNAKRNYAFATYTIDGHYEQYISVSGSLRVPLTVEPTQTRVFQLTRVNGYFREHDAEVKILEAVASRLKPDSKGVMRLFSERPFCESCSLVIKQFQERYPGVVLLPSSGAGPAGD